MNTTNLNRPQHLTDSRVFRWTRSGGCIVCSRALTECSELSPLSDRTGKPGGHCKRYKLAGMIRTTGRGCWHDRTPPLFAHWSCSDGLAGSSVSNITSTDTETGLWHTVWRTSTRLWCKHGDSKLLTFVVVKCYTFNECWCWLRDNDN